MNELSKEWKVVEVKLWVDKLEEALNEHSKDEWEVHSIIGSGNGFALLTLCRPERW